MVQRRWERVLLILCMVSIIPISSSFLGCSAAIDDNDLIGNQSTPQENNNSETEDNNGDENNAANNNSTQNNSTPDPNENSDPGDEPDPNENSDPGDEPDPNENSDPGDEPDPNENSDPGEEPDPNENSDPGDDPDDPDFIPVPEEERCPKAARPVYVVDRNNKLLYFEPPQLEFVEVGQLNCPAASSISRPISMSVDRLGKAWILYNSGELFKVDPTNAECEATSFQPNQHGLEVFGMGFVLQPQSDDRETLYIAGGARSMIAYAPARLGSLNFSNFAIETYETVPSWPELSGTAASELWAFFPLNSPPKITRIDPETGEENITYPVTGLPGQPHSWSFAFWGGDFWIFYKSQSMTNSRVYQLSRRTGTVTEVISDTGYHIVGAGVSTCAPVDYYQ